MPQPILALNHVGIHVADVAKSIAFYQDILGLAPIDRPDMGFPGAWLGLGPNQELHLIGKNAHPDMPPSERHFALQVADAEAWAQHLANHGIECDGPRPRADGATQLFFRDPDGHVIELSQLRD